MKKLFAISCAALIALILVVSVTVSVAFADAGDVSVWNVSLPEEETITQRVSTEGISDYAVTLYTDSDNQGVTYSKYAFAYNSEIIIYSCYDGESGQIIEIDDAEYNGGTIETVELSGIIQLEYSKEGDLYCRDVFSNLYVVRSGSDVGENADSDDFAFSDYDDFLGMVSDGKNLYMITDEGKLNVLNIETWETATYPADGEETFKNLKKTENTVYVLGDVLYMATGGDILPMSFVYEDYDTEMSIEVENTFDLLKVPADEIYFAEIDGDALLIPVDLDESGETFEIPGRIRRFSDVKKSVGTSFTQILLESESAVLICYGRETYLTYRDKIESTLSYDFATPVHSVYYALDETNVYSMPYPGESTRTRTLSMGEGITATGVVDSADISFYDTFYKIEYTDEDGETLTGYVLTAMFSEYDFDDDNPEMISAEFGETSYENNVTLCVIIMVLAAILMVAAIYLTLVLTSGKRKK